MWPKNGGADYCIFIEITAYDRVIKKIPTLNNTTTYSPISVNKTIKACLNACIVCVICRYIY